MPYTYMPLLLCSLPDEEAYSYMVEVPKQEEKKSDWEMFVGEAYKLPFTGTGLFTWKSSDESIASIDGKGIMAGKSAGDVLLTVSTPSGKQRTFKVHVSDS